MNIASAMFIAAVSGAGLAAIDYAIDGYMFLVVPLVLATCWLLSVDRTPKALPDAKSEAQRLTLRAIGRILLRPFLVTFAGLASFLQMFGYLRDL